MAKLSLCLKNKVICMESQKTIQKNSKNNQMPNTYISLFSGGGIGCYGFRLEGYECIATNEINERRLNIQKYNNKCRYKRGYIVGNLSDRATKNQIRNEFEFWKKNRGVKDLDVIIATPPCQGMSVANHKKNNELGRNSLVVESIKLVNELNPKFFVFENVRSFLNSICTDSDGNNRRIRDSIDLNLGGTYNIQYSVINFKDYGNPSSRTRTIVLGVRKNLLDVTPLDFFPTLQEQKTVRQTIGHLPSLKDMGEIDAGDVFHHFRRYSEEMRSWIENINEGESAFDNSELKRRPHRVVNGVVVFNKMKNGDKYTRCIWDKHGACVHTRNDILSSQATLHPTDDRVFSVRELMLLMSIPNSFSWSSTPERVINQYTHDEKRAFLRKEELNIRQSIGEAVPTTIFRQVAAKMKSWLKTHKFEEKEVQKIIKWNNLLVTDKLKKFVNENIDCYSFVELSKIVELANAQRHKHAGYYTRQDICFTVIKDLPDASQFSSIRILEPSVGTGNFLPLLIEKYKTVQNVEIDVIDIDKNAIEILKILINKLSVPKNIAINYLNLDFLLFGQHDSMEVQSKSYDIVVGNPPFGKITNNNDLLKKYKIGKNNKATNNLFSFFLEKAIHLADCVALILPKSLLSAPEFDHTREFVSQYSMRKIIDYGERGFKGVRIETICLILDTTKRTFNENVMVESYIKKEITYQRQNYICSKEFPYWLLYRDTFFDRAASKLKLGVFAAYRDRQITKKITKPEGKVRVLKSRNIGSNTIIDIPNYDSYLDNHENILIAKFLNHESAVLVPNLTYYPRACFLPKNTIIDGSVAVLIPKNPVDVTEDDLRYYNSEEFTEFYRIARNFGTRSLNIDKNSVYFFGLSKERLNYKLHSH